MCLQCMKWDYVSYRYRMKIFPHDFLDTEKELSYNKHLLLTNDSFNDASVSCTKKTHAPRGSSARAAELSG